MDLCNDLHRARNNIPRCELKLHFFYSVGNIAAGGRDPELHRKPPRFPYPLFYRLCELSQMAGPGRPFHEGIRDPDVGFALDIRI